MCQGKAQEALQRGTVEAQRQAAGAAQPDGRITIAKSQTDPAWPPLSPAAAAFTGAQGRPRPLQKLRYDSFWETQHLVLST